MYYLSLHESQNFVDWSEQVIRGEADPRDFKTLLRPVMVPVFYFYCGVLLCKLGQVKRDMQCFIDGSLHEADNMFSNAFIASFMERHDMDLLIPAVCFEDPRPYVHFTTTPELQLARKNFIKQSAMSLPRFEEPFKLMDIGTGNGALAVDLLRYLTPPKSWIVPLIRPKLKVGNQAKYLNFNAELNKQNTTLDFEDSLDYRAAVGFGERRGFNPSNTILDQMKAFTRKHVQKLKDLGERLLKAAPSMTRSQVQEREAGQGAQMPELAPTPGANLKAVPDLLPAMAMPVSKEDWIESALKGDERIAEAENNEVFVAWASLIRVLAASRMSAYHGPIIYSNYGSSDKTILYDSEADLYNKWFAELDEIESLFSKNLEFGGMAMAIGQGLAEALEADDVGMDCGVGQQGRAVASHEDGERFV